MNRHFISTRTAILSFVLFAFNLGYTQTIKGTITSSNNNKTLSYTNIDITHSGKIVLSILSDKKGEYQVHIDSGVYVISVTHSGYQVINQSIRISSNHELNFSLKPLFKEDETVKNEVVFDDKMEDDEPVADEIVVSSSRSRRHKSAMYSESSTDSESPTSIYKDNDQASSGKLTATEINDFAKWDLWKDISEDELKVFREIWTFSPQGRYSVQVTNPQGIPIANARIDLIQNKKSIYTARTDNTGKAELWLTLIDGMQQSSINTEIKIQYKETSTTIKQPKPINKGMNVVTLNVDCNQSNAIDIAFVVDATGSMADEMAFLKEELNDIIYKSKQIDQRLILRFANVFYRDHGDQYLTRTMDFSRVLTASTDYITTQVSGGGGDFPEAVDVALDSAINGLHWSDDARTKLLFLVLDAPPHENPEVLQKLHVLTRAAASKGIRIIPLLASGTDRSTEYLMRSIALSTNGTSIFLTDHSGIGNPHLEPITDNIEVETLNELMVRVIKSMIYLPDCENKVPELNLNYPDSSVTYLPTSDSTNSNIQDPELPLTEIKWTYYPNPTQDKVYVKANTVIKELHLTDLSGKILQQIEDIQPEQQMVVDLSQYASGIYLLRCPIGDKWVTGKIILSRS